MDWLRVDCTKRGSASKPTFFQQQTKLIMGRLYASKYFVIFVWLLLFSILILFYYVYLLKLYLMDDTFDIRGPKELIPSEKLTIRVLEPLNIQDLNRFVLHYSICPVVHEIQVLWHSTNKEPPHADAFKYTTTHGIVSFHKLEHSQKYYESFLDSSKVLTHGIMLLEPDIFISCQDLRLAQTVWRSSYDSQVGLFPRVAKSVGSHKFEYQSPSSVALQQKYSLLLSSALITGKQHIESLKNSENVKTAIRSHPKCYDIAISMWIMSQTHKPPVWIDVEYDIVHDAQVASFPTWTTEEKMKILPKESSTNEERTNCIHILSKAMNIDEMQYSSVKATRATSHWTW